jgi:GNAT superfamily N-acetyltransferase
MLRSATLADWEPLRVLLGELDQHHASLQPRFFRARPRERAYLHGLIIDDNADVIVAEVLGRVVGVISARIYETPRDPTLTPRRRVHVDDLVVCDEHRREGLGRQLMAEVGRWARGRGAQQLVLTVWAGNDEAEALHESMGYRTVSRVMALDLD